MARIVELAVLTSALAGVATFLGFRAMFRKAVRGLGRKPKIETKPTAEIEERNPNA